MPEWAIERNGEESVNECFLVAARVVNSADRALPEAYSLVEAHPVETEPKTAPMNAALPFDPEPLALLQIRYPLAEADVIDVESVQMKTALPPCLNRRHVFDSEDGLRLTVSRDRLPDGAVVLHVSGTVIAGTVIHQRVEQYGADQWLWTLMTERWRAISDRSNELQLVGFKGSMPHFRVI